jgi:Uncharacterized protein conserved in bacteria (DUF2237)
MVPLRLKVCAWTRCAVSMAPSACCTLAYAKSRTNSLLGSLHRWKQAHDAGKAPKIFLEATDAKALDTVPLELLKQYAVEDVQ